MCAIDAREAPKFGQFIEKAEDLYEFDVCDMLRMEPNPGFEFALTAEEVHQYPPISAPEQMPSSPIGQHQTKHSFQPLASAY